MGTPRSCSGCGLLAWHTNEADGYGTSQAFWVVVSVVVGGIYFEEFDELYGSHIVAVVTGELLTRLSLPLCRFLSVLLED